MDQPRSWSDLGRGMVLLKWCGEELLATYGDVRRSMDFNAFAFGAIGSDPLPHGQVWSIIIQTHISCQSPRYFSTFGFHLKAGIWHPTADRIEHPRVALVLEFAVRSIWILNNVFALRLGRALSKLPPHQVADQTTVIWWRNHPEAAHQHQVMGAPPLSTRDPMHSLA